MGPEVGRREYTLNCSKLYTLIHSTVNPPPRYSCIPTVWICTTLHALYTPRTVTPRDSKGSPPECIFRAKASALIDCSRDV